MWHWQRTNVYKKYALWGKLFFISAIGHISILVFFFFIYHEPACAITIMVVKKSERHKDTVFVGGSPGRAVRGKGNAGAQKQQLKAKSPVRPTQKKEIIKKEIIKKANTSIDKKKEAVVPGKGTRVQEVKKPVAKIDKPVKKVPIKSVKKLPVKSVKKIEPVQKKQVLAALAEPVKKTELPKPEPEQSKELAQEAVANRQNKEVLSAHDTEPESDQGLPIVIGGGLEDTYYDQRHEALRQELGHSWQQPFGITTQSACIVKVSVDMHGKTNGIEMIQGSGFLMFDISVQSVCHGYQWPLWVCNRSVTIAFK